MSNQQVGAVYQTVISDVIDSSRVDFEEGGVEESVLEELKLGWQAKLSQLNVATFPWDPKPDPPAAIANPPTVPSNAGYSHATPPQQHQLTQGHPMPQQMNQMNQNQNQNQNRNQGQNPGQNLGQNQGQHQGQHPNQGQPHIKAEPDESNGFQQGSIPSGLSAQERAAQLVQNNFGQRAAQSIGKIRESAPQYQQGPPQHQGQPQHHQGAPQQQQGHPQHQGQQSQFQRGPPNPQLQHQMNMHPQQPQHPQLNNMQQQQRPQGAPQQQQQQQQRPQMTQEQYQAMMAQNARQQAAQAQAAQQQHQQQAQNGSVKNAQIDGAGDDVDTTDVIKRFDSAGNEIAMGRIEIDSLLRAKIQAMGQTMEGGGLMLPLKQASTQSKRERKVVKTGNGAGGVDGGDEEDADAINSDLDDPDDGLNDDEDDDDSMGHIMLCMYDKVQRVKNKWKCVMKDGVLTVNGKEYVFHKASGEYEW